MYLSNRDAKWAVECGKLILDPPPEQFGGGYDETSVDLYLDGVEVGARVWDIVAYQKAVSHSGPRGRAEIALGAFDWDTISADYLIEVPQESPDPRTAADQRVFRRGQDVIVRHSGFLLWTTKERVGTPRIDLHTETPQRHPELMCFVNAKSTKARTGLLVHFTAPTIHAGWVGKITLEIANLGPFDFVLRENDAIAQLTVATISSAPDLRLRASRQLTQDQVSPAGPPPRPRPPRRRPRSGGS